jgi:hypothetical protein
MLERRYVEMHHTVTMTNRSIISPRFVIATIILAILLAGFAAVPLIAFAETANPNNIDMPPTIASCSGWLSFASMKCWTDWLLVNIGTMFLSLGVLVVYLGGYVFDSLLQAIVLGFGDTLKHFQLIDIISNAWTFFRDIANILLIGLFVFIAISLILGLKEYGQKRLVARVLLIAILMNFSLLFAKIVIDASNYVAYAIYAQTAGAGQTTGSVASISDKFLKPMKIQSVYDSKRVNIEVNNQPDKGGFTALMFSLVAFFLLTAIGLTLLYGAFLLAQRAVTLLVIMIVAPVAFVSYLMPSMEQSSWGWKSWWRSLFNNAVFAPVLVMLLTVSFLIVGEASKATANVSLGAAIVQPYELRGAWEILFLYLIGLLLLIGSFIMSSRLAGAMGDMKLGKWATGGALAFGMRGLGFAGQQTVGRLAMMRAQNKDKQLSEARRAYAAPGGQTSQNWDKIQKLVAQKGRAEAAMKSSFNLMNTQLGKALAGTAGLKGALAGEKKGSFNDTVHKREEKAIAAAKNVKLTDGDKAAILEQEKKVREEASKATIESHGQNAEAAKKGLEEATSALQTVSKQMEQARASNPDLKAAETEHKQLSDAKIQTEERFKKEISDLQRDAARGPENERAEAIKQIEAKRAEHSAELTRQEERIKTAHENVKSETAKIDAAFRPTVDSINARIKSFKDAQSDAETQKAALAKQIETDAKKAAKEIIDAGEKNFTESRNIQGSRYATWSAHGETAQHQIHHGLDEAFKTKTRTQKLTESIEKGLKDLNKVEGNETESA